MVVIVVAVLGYFYQMNPLCVQSTRILHFSPISFLVLLSMDLNEISVVERNARFGNLITEYIQY